ncbi:MAG: MinD/ParA family protein [Desulfobacteraceae bacterium]|nr:MAG: MinD/ParA family protein [Desulfobacteraceae bacterium]
MQMENDPMAPENSIETNPEAEIRLEEDLGIDGHRFEILKRMLRQIYPEDASIDSEFLVRLTPSQLKQAYMRRASDWHPQNEDISAAALPEQQDRYRQLTRTYNALLPCIQILHRKVQRISHLNALEWWENDASDKTIIAVGGAKGGVGKSVISANIAVGLAFLGHRVVLADLDLGGPDAHLYVGVKSLPKNWNDFLEKRVESIEELRVQTPFEGLTIIGGDASKLGAANISHPQKLKIIRNLKALEADFVVIDLGGDTSYNVLDFFLLADQKIVVTGTEPASVLDSYSFIKVALHRFLDRFFAAHPSLHHLSKSFQNASSMGSRSFAPELILSEVRACDASAYIKLREQFDRYHMSLVVNMAESRKDASVGLSIQRLAKAACAVDIDVLGTIPFDAALRKAVRRFTPFVVEDPGCRASKALYQVLAGILLLQEPRAIRAELLQKSGPIRKSVKTEIDAADMRLTGLTPNQIHLLSEGSPRLRDRFQKILGFLTADRLVSAPGSSLQ